MANFQRKLLQGPTKNIAWWTVCLGGISTFMHNISIRAQDQEFEDVAVRMCIIDELNVPCV